MRLRHNLRVPRSGRGLGRWRRARPGHGRLLLKIVRLVMPSPVTVWRAMITRLKRTGPTVKLDLGAEESAAVFTKFVDAAIGCS